MPEVIPKFLVGRFWIAYCIGLAFVCLTLDSCTRNDPRADALVMVGAKLDTNFVSNLVHEASLCIDAALAQPSSTGAEYYPAWTSVPFARKLSSAVWVDRAGEDAPYMVIMVPVPRLTHPCEVFVLVKPQGFVSPSETLRCKDSLLKKYSEQIYLCAIER